MATRLTEEEPDLLIKAIFFSHPNYFRTATQ
jgi:hypothetical protein